MDFETFLKEGSKPPRTSRRGWFGACGTQRLCLSFYAAHLRYAHQTIAPASGWVPPPHPLHDVSKIELFRNIWNPILGDGIKEFNLYEGRVWKVGLPTGLVRPPPKTLHDFSLFRRGELMVVSS